MTDGISDADAIVASQVTPERFALVFDRHYPAIQGYLRRRIERSSADDLAAETFIVAFRRRKDYEPSQTGARPWLFGIAVNLLRRHRRHERRQLRAYARTAVDPLLSGTADAAHGVDDAAIGPHLARALASLASRDREVLSCTPARTSRMARSPRRLGSRRAPCARACSGLGAESENFSATRGQVKGRTPVSSSSSQRAHDERDRVDQTVQGQSLSD